MLSRLVPLVVLLVMLVACGTGEGTPAAVGPSTTIESPGPEPSPEVTSPTSPSATPPTDPPSTTIERGEPADHTDPADLAPDFTLELGEGGTFILSQEARPVFMVFWAEW